MLIESSISMSAMPSSILSLVCSEQPKYNVHFAFSLYGKYGTMVWRIINLTLLIRYEATIIWDTFQALFWSHVMEACSLVAQTISDARILFIVKFPTNWRICIAAIAITSLWIIRMSTWKSLENFWWYFSLSSSSIQRAISLSTIESDSLMHRTVRLQMVFAYQGS